MFWTIIFNITALFFAFLASNSKDHYKNLFVSFLIIFLFLALRYDFGNDYMAYMDYFSSIQKTSIRDLLFRRDSSLNQLELGYNLLNKIFPSFYMMVAVLSLLYCYVYYNAIKSYGVNNQMWFSVFILLFDPYLMLVQSSAMRQTLVICLFIYSLRYLVERNLWKYFMLILFGSLFHRSALFLIPFYFVLTPVKWNKWLLVALISLYVLVLFSGNVFLSHIENITKNYFPQYFEKYMQEIVGNPLNSGLGVLFLSLLLILFLWSHNKGESSDVVISKISILSFVISPIGIYLSMFGRIQMYFSPFIFLSLPYTVSVFKSRHLRIIISSIIILWYLYGFLKFFQSPVWIDKYYDYKINLLQF